MTYTLVLVLFMVGQGPASIANIGTYADKVSCEAAAAAAHNQYKASSGPGAVTGLCLPSGK